MKTRSVILTAMVVQVALLSLPGGLKAAEGSKVGESNAPALTGRVSSQEEGAMEGVLVTARKDGSTFSITVVSNAQGNYSFPRSRMESGSYALRIRAAGWELYDGGPVEITASKVTQHDLKLSKTHNLAAQLSNQEWLASASGTETQKRALLYCVSCHTVEREFRTDYNTVQFAMTVARMHNWLNVSTPQQPQYALNGGFRFPPGVAEYLSTVNLSSGRTTWPFELKALPRPKGKATQVIMTEYDLPRQYAQPHDVLPDSQGLVWYNDFGRQFIGKLDAKTGKAVEFPVPMLKFGYTGSHDLGFDREETPWVAMAANGGIGRFDRKTEKFQTWSVPDDPGAKPVAQSDESVPDEASATPASINRGSGGSQNVISVRPQFMHVDGKVWLLLGGSRVQRIDVASSQWLPESIAVFKAFPKDSPGAGRPHAIYDIFTDSQNNCWFSDLGSEYIGKVDAKTLKVSFYQVPTMSSFPRRAHFDKQDRLWFAEYLGNKIAMFDSKTERFQEWPMPNAFNWPYDVNLDKNDYAWTAGMVSDHASRLNIKTGEFTEYLLPRFANIRHVEVDNSTNPPSLWVGSNHQGTIVRVEPLE